MTCRADRLRLALDRAPEPYRAQLLELLDEISRPMTIREIEAALRAGGHAKSWSAHIAGALKDLDLVIISPKE